MLTIAWSRLLILLVVVLSSPTYCRPWYQNDTEELPPVRPVTESEIAVRETSLPPEAEDGKNAYHKEWNAILQSYVAGQWDDLVELRLILGTVEGPYSAELDVFTVQLYCVSDCDELNCSQLSLCDNRNTAAAIPMVVDRASLCRKPKENCGGAASTYVNVSQYTNCCTRMKPNSPWYCDGSQGNTNACWKERGYQAVPVAGLTLKADSWLPGVDLLGSRPLSVGLLVVVSLMGMALCFLINKWRQAKAKINRVNDKERGAQSPFLPWDPADVAITIPEARVLIAYYPDSDEFCAAIASLADLLSTDGHCKVTNMCSKLELMDPDTLEPMMSSPEVTVLVVPSRIGKMGHNVYFDQLLPGKIVAPFEPRDASHKLFYDFLYYARAGTLSHKQNRVAVLGLHPSWKEEYYNQALGRIHDHLAFDIPENITGLLRWLHGLDSRMELPIEISRQQDLRFKINVLREFVATNDEYQDRHILVHA